MRYRELGFAVAVLSAIAADVAAQEAGRSFYFGADFGVSAAWSLESTRTNVGVPTNCDQWLEPANIGGERLTLPASVNPDAFRRVLADLISALACWLVSMSVMRVLGRFALRPNTCAADRMGKK